MRKKKNRVQCKYAGQVQVLCSTLKFGVSALMFPVLNDSQRKRLPRSVT